MSKVWFITGASSGFGMAIAEAALARGDRVVATARHPERLADLVSRYPQAARSARLDVTAPSQIAPALAVAAGLGGIDVLVCNAGYGLIGALEEVSDEQIARNLETNLIGPMRLVRAALPMLRAQAKDGRRSHLVMMSAAAAIQNYAGFAVYGAAKAGLEAMSESLALELAPAGIRVTIVQPGPFRTDFIARNLDRAERPIADYDATSGKFARLLAGMSGKQTGDPSRAAAAILAAVYAERPPLRLVLGKYALGKARKKLASAAAELDAWEATSVSTDSQ